MKAEEAMVRVFVGGLGESVTKENLKNMFESVGGGGTVETIDIIRTKGRSFAYVNFCPYSDSFFHKLFSTYNGCVWKGGRLKLENAKENYLSRLKREWEEDEQLVNCVVDATQNINTTTFEQFSSSSPEKKQIQIFFPRLGKLKSLPLSGTGKHKYSFPRVEVSSSLPIHFCDCEEHFIPASSQKKLDSDAQGEKAARNDTEIKLMNSVMNKLFEGEKISHAGSVGTEPTSIEGKSITLTSNSQFDRSEIISESDEDDFILNVVTSRSNKSAVPWNKENEIISNIQDVPKKQKLHVGRDAKKSKPILLSHRSDQQKPISGIGANGNFPGNVPIIDEEPKDKTDTNTVSHKVGRGSAWLQKSSWTQLVGERNSSCFSITQIVPDLTPEKQIQMEPKVVNFKGANIDEIVKQNSSRFGVKKKREEDNEAPAPTMEKVGAEKSGGVGDYVIGETCSFMRSAASLKEWAKSKAALNVSLKRKRDN